MNPNIIEKIVRLTDYIQITYGSLFSKNRKQDIVRIRYCLWLYLFRILKMEPKQIALEFKKDRSTVLYGIDMASFRTVHWSDYSSLWKEINSIFEDM